MSAKRKVSPNVEFSQLRMPTLSRRHKAFTQWRNGDTRGPYGISKIRPHHIFTSHYAKVLSLEYLCGAVMKVGIAKET